MIKKIIKHKRSTIVIVCGKSGKDRKHNWLKAAA